MTVLRIGFIPLTDAAVLIAAARLGFAEREGIAIELRRESSWANVRDKLVLGHLDAAHLLSPLAMAIHLGLAGLGPQALAVPARLNLNGNAITVSRTLRAQLGDHGFDGTIGTLAPALGAAVRAHRRADPPAFGMVFPYSSHAYQLRLLLAAAGLVPDADVRLVVVPPPFMVEALANGIVDGFCVGSPWNSVAVDAGHGHIVALGPDLLADCPEKVLALGARRAEQEPALISALVRALRGAADWCAEPSNRRDLAALMASPEHLDVSAAIVERTLSGMLVLGPDGAVRECPGFMKLGPHGVTRPDPRDAAWVIERMTEAGQIAGAVPAAAALYRPDLFDAA